MKFVLLLWIQSFASVYDIHRINAIDMSVCRDATYTLASSQSTSCSGNGDIPQGVSCPLKGDLAVADCHPSLPSFVLARGCVLPEDAECRIISGTTWGCVLPSIGCRQQETQCPTWTMSDSDEVRSIDTSDSLNGNKEYDESWFVSTSLATELYRCGKKATETPTDAATITTPQPTIDDAIDVNVEHLSATNHCDP